MRSIRVLTIISVVFSLLVGVLVYSHVAGTESRLLDQLQPTKVLIATADIEPGTKRGDLVALTEEIVVPQRSFPRGAVARTTDLPADFVALTRIIAGSYIYKSTFGDASRLVGGLVIPNGKVVLSLDLNSQERIGRFIGPGATVAVYSTSREGSSQMIVSGASVLAIGDNTSSTVGANESTLVTLAVDPDSAKRILAANQNGIIQLALLGQGVDSAATTGP